MTEDQVVQWVPEYGPWGLVAFFVILVLTGRLVPRRQLQDWIDAYRESDRQRQALIDTLQVTRSVLQALPDPEQAREDQSP